MEQKFYKTPELEILTIGAEGVLCSSVTDPDNPMILPGTDWKDEEVW